MDEIERSSRARAYLCCTGDCRQGRDCPASKESAEDAIGLWRGLRNAIAIAAVCVLVGLAGCDVLRRVFG